MVGPTEGRKNLEISWKGQKAEKRSLSISYSVSCQAESDHINCFHKLLKLTVQ